MRSQCMRVAAYRPRALSASPAAKASANALVRPQLLGLVLDVGGVLGGPGVAEFLQVGVDGGLAAGAGDREAGADAVAVHAGLAGRDVLAGRRRDHQVAGDARADVLDLADDPQPVLGEKVELGDLGAVVRDGEGQRAAGGMAWQRLCTRSLCW